MGTQTYAGFKADIKLAIGQRSDVDTQIDSVINTAYKDLTTRYRFFGTNYAMDYAFPELDSSTTTTTRDGTAYITRPPSALTIYTVWDSENDRKLTMLMPREYWKKAGRNDTDAEGEPTHWTPYGSYIYLYPTPDDAYDITTYYRQRVESMSKTDDTTSIGQEWDEPLTRLAMVYIMERLRDWDAAEKHRTVFGEMVTARLEIYGEQQKDRKEFVRPSYTDLEGYKYR